MQSNVLIKEIKKKLSLIDNENSIIVLKGIPMSFVDPECNPETIDNIVKNKMGYFMKIASERKYVTYEEFLILNAFITTQYEHVYILNNNIYMNQYPIDDHFSEETREGLLNHFTDSENDDDDSYIGNIDEVISLYNGIREYNGFLIGAYCEENIKNDIKIEEVNIFDYSLAEVLKVKDNNEGIVFDIKEEADYIDFVKKLFSEPEEIYVKTNNYTGDVDQLEAHISLVKEYWADYTDIYYIQLEDVASSFEHRDEYTDILKKYWGYDKFRNFKVYDLKKIEEGKKETIEISQEQVISDLVQQAEICASGESEGKDIFVTAPTGAGKSVMFQVPAIYLAEKYNLLTIVISPLIGLMKDQVGGLEKRNYRGAKTINSDISPIVKEDILQKVADSEYHILYLSPETLLARSTVEQLIGDREIGMIIIDEAHIVTTWGKQFRPDYWYLGEHIRKLKNNQKKKSGKSFVVGTFTATAIYHGKEDMYEETRNSLHMFEPITYLGYMQRSEDINIVINKKKKGKGEKAEYENDKFKEIEAQVQRALITNKKMLIYFPTVRLIEACYESINDYKLKNTIARFYGPMDKDQKDENYEEFLSGKRLVMFATKAFGMGIDIDNIEIVEHFAPTGNVCDYVQEIGRAARAKDLVGEAYYHYNSHDFKYINRLHGLSSIKKYQIVEVVKKIDQLYRLNLKTKSNVALTKKKNAMLLDAENFTYIFDGPVDDDNNNNNINKVKTALLIIQKDFEAKMGFSPITVRPIPLFSIGLFQIRENTQKSLLKRYPECLEEINKENRICRVNLEMIWNKDYKDKSFPQFKYMLYSKDKDLAFNQRYTVIPALSVAIEYKNDYITKFNSVWNTIKNEIRKGVTSQEYIPLDNFVKALRENCGIKKYKAQTICDVLFSSMDIYRKKFSNSTNSIMKKNELKSGEVKLQFNVAINSYIGWVQKGFDRITKETKNGELYIINDGGKDTKYISIVLGILEAFDVLSFEMKGGANSQLYIYINQSRSLSAIINNPDKYNNRLLDMVQERHTISVKMLTYLYESDFSSDEMWDVLEDYFLGIIPEKVKSECRKQNPDILFD